MEQKASAIEIMKKMGFPPNIIDDFQKTGTVYLFENGVAERIEARHEKLTSKIKDLEDDGCFVYGVIHNEIYGGAHGDIYNFLIISPYAEDLPYTLRTGAVQGIYSVCAYCWNVETDIYSESGMIGVCKTEQGFERIT